MSFLPIKCRRYLADRNIAFTETEENGQLGLIFKNLALPTGVYDVEIADILVLLPAGYPDTPPDMFHAVPWLRLVTTNGFPNCADQPVQFSGTNWQRWSRHNNEWRSGIDGIWTMLKRIEAALEKERVAA